jgi:hypothetical protein
MSVSSLLGATMIAGATRSAGRENVACAAPARQIRKVPSATSTARPATSTPVSAAPVPRATARSSDGRPISAP